MGPNPLAFCNNRLPNRGKLQAYPYPTRIVWFSSRIVGLSCGKSCLLKWLLNITLTIFHVNPLFCLGIGLSTIPSHSSSKQGGRRGRQGRRLLVCPLVVEENGNGGCSSPMEYQKHKTSRASASFFHLLVFKKSVVHGPSCCITFCKNYSGAHLIDASISTDRAARYLVIHFFRRNTLEARFEALITVYLSFSHVQCLWTSEPEDLHASSMFNTFDSLFDVVNV